MTRNVLVLLTVLLVTHSPAKWGAGLLLLALLPLIKGRRKLNVLETVTMVFLGLILSLGILLNLANNQNIPGIVFSVLLLMSNFLIVIIYAGRSQLSDVARALRIFTIVQLVAVIIQYCVLIVVSGSLNIFSVDQSYGDLLAGTFLSFSTPLAVTFSFVALFFVWQYFSCGRRRDLYYCFASVFIVAATGAMSVLILFAPVAVAYVIIKTMTSAIDTAKKIYLVSFLAVTVLSAAVLQASNFAYAEYMYKRMVSEQPPFKVELMKQVFEPSSDSHKFLIGLGAGNFSSRAALLLTGQYLSDQSFVPRSASDETQRYISPFFNVHLRGQTVNDYDALSVVSEPFSMYTTMFAEYGLLGVALFLTLFGYYFLSRKFSNLEVRAFTALAMLFFLINSWLEYPSFPAIFFLLMFCAARASRESSAVLVRSSLTKHADRSRVQ